MKTMKLLANDGEADFPFHKRSMPFLTFGAPIGNQAFGIGDALSFPVKARTRSKLCSDNYTKLTLDKAIFNRS